MTCTHERIKTWLLADTHEPAGMWSCAGCGEKFLPITQALAETKAAVRWCELMTQGFPASRSALAGLIRAEYPDAFADTKDDDERTI